MTDKAFCDVLMETRLYRLAYRGVYGSTFSHMLRIFFLSFFCSPLFFLYFHHRPISGGNYRIEMDKEFFMSPARAYDHSTRDDLRIRFPHYDERELDLLLRDLKEENRKLDELLMQYSLKEFWNEVIRLAGEQCKVKRLVIE